MPSQLTVLIPCKDEQMNIRPCIESVLPLADEVLIADSGSTDSTLDIASSICDCRIIKREYIHSANFKNWAIPQAKHKWVLVIDADERITEPLAREIRAILENPPADKDAFWIGRINHYMGHPIQRSGWAGDGVIRLFRRDACSYRERWVHAEVEVDACRLGHLRGRMLHYTTWNSDDYSKKMTRYATWGAKNYRDQGRQPSFLSMFFAAPLRFVQLYFFRLGFLDGIPGLQVCMHAAFYSYLKQAKLWEMQHAIPQPNPEAANPVAHKVQAA